MDKEYIKYEDGTRVELSEDDSPELTEEFFKNAKHGIDHFSKEIQEAIKNSKGGRPVAENPKEKVTIRLDADILAQLRASGKGWQSRVNDVVREWVEKHPQA